MAQMLRTHNTRCMCDVKEKVIIVCCKLRSSCNNHDLGNSAAKSVLFSASNLQLDWLISAIHLATVPLPPIKPLFVQVRSTPSIALLPTFIAGFFSVFVEQKCNMVTRQISWLFSKVKVWQIMAWLLFEWLWKLQSILKQVTHDNSVTCVLVHFGWKILVASYVHIALITQQKWSHVLVFNQDHPYLANFLSCIIITCSYWELNLRPVW